MNAIVTGAARGLGEAVAERLVRDGGNVLVIDIAPGVKQAAERLGAVREGSIVWALEGDVADEALPELAVDTARSRLGTLDILVNCAGIGGPTTDLIDTPVDELRPVIEVNLLGSMYMARASAIAMVQEGTRGVIINIGSILGQQGAAGAAPYCATKGGVALLTQALALELAPHGIRVNTVAPGYVETQMHMDELLARAAAEGTTLEVQIERVRQSIPLRRYGLGSDVAGAVAWLVSEDASYVTGQTIGVNGGIVLS
jgi:NAD(P)-dependent dehydrogenase (short-subunit alcohol dehydrogenase family)